MADQHEAAKHRRRPAQLVEATAVRGGVDADEADDLLEARELGDIHPGGLALGVERGLRGEEREAYCEGIMLSTPRMRYRMDFRPGGD